MTQARGARNLRCGLVVLLGVLIACATKAGTSPTPERPVRSMASDIAPSFVCDTGTPSGAILLFAEENGQFVQLEQCVVPGGLVQFMSTCKAAEAVFRVTPRTDDLFTVGTHPCPLPGSTASVTWDGGSYTITLRHLGDTCYLAAARTMDGGSAEWTLDTPCGNPPGGTTEALRGEGDVIRGNIEVATTKGGGTGLDGGTDLR